MLHRTSSLAVGRTVLRIFLTAAGLLVACVLVWQGVTASGAPDPTLPHTSPGVAILDIGVLVFREGLECILVISAITASMMGANQSYRRPIAAGVAVGFFATIVTWFIAVGIISDLTQSLPALDVQAGTGLLAVIVLLIVMNWFFHKVYWTGWISMHNRKKRDLLKSAKTPETSARRLLLGMGLLGFASFVAHRRLPYKKMLVIGSYFLARYQTVMLPRRRGEMPARRPEAPPTKVATPV